MLWLVRGLPLVQPVPPGRPHLASSLRFIPIPALVSLRRAVFPATGPLIRAGRDLLLIRGSL
jgi:hypothetical protein